MDVFILLSIKPKFVKEILLRRKRYEFRKQIYKKNNTENTTTIFIYSSHPEKKIVAKFQHGKIIKNNPKELWKQCKDHAGISETEFFAYFKDKSIGYAIEIQNLTQFEPPIDPKTLDPNFRAPQSFCYLSEPFQQQN